MSKETFDFSEALKRMKEGKWVTWASFAEYAFSIRTNEYGKEVVMRMPKCKGGKYWIEEAKPNDIRTSHIICKDWEEVNEE